jgi:hypothetical protein
LRDERHDLVHDARDADAGGAEQDGEHFRARETREHRERLDSPERDDRLQRSKRWRRG